MSKFCLAVVASLILVTGCNSSTSPSGGSNNNTTSKPLTTPGVGSVYIYHYYDIDSIGRKVDSSEHFDTVNIIATGITQYGRSNVLQIRDDGKLPLFFLVIGSNFINYDSTGDISFYFNLESGPGYKSGWSTVPITSKGERSFTEKDTVVSGTHETRITKRTYSGATTLALAGKSFNAAMFAVLDEKLSDPNMPITEYFDTQSGMLLRMDISGKQTAHGYDKGGRYELLSATIK